MPSQKYKFPEDAKLSIIEFVNKDEKTEISDNVFILIETNGCIKKYTFSSNEDILISRMSSSEVYRDKVDEISITPLVADSGKINGYWVYIRTSSSNMVLSVRPKNQVETFSLELLEVI